MQLTDIKNRMRNGTGVGALIHGGQNLNSDHYIDSLQRFSKDFATQDRQKRQEERRRKIVQIERRRHSTMDRQQRRINFMDDEFQRQQERREKALNEETMRTKKRANVTSLPYNPISLQYESSVPGINLKRQDEDHQIRNLVRAHNLDSHGSGKFNPLTGQSRIPIQKLVPDDLGNRFSSRLNQHYEGYKIKLPQSNFPKRRMSQM